MSAFSNARCTIRFSLVTGLAVGLVLAIGGCGTVSNLGSSVSPEKLKRLDQVAVASITGANRLKSDLGQDQSASGAQAMSGPEEAAEEMKRNRNRAKPDFGPSMDRSHEYVFGELQDVLPFGFIDEQAVLGASAYQNFEVQRETGPVGGMVDDPEDLYVSPKSYRAVPPSLLRSNAEKRRELFDLLPAETDAVLVMELRHRVGKAVAEADNETEEGNGPRRSRLQLEEGDRVTAQVQAEVKTQVMMPNGNLIMDVTQKEWSGDSFAFVYGEGWNAEQLTDLTVKATENALKETTSYVKGELSKE